MSIKSRLSKLEKLHPPPPPDLPAFAVQIDGGYKVRFMSGRTETLAELPAPCQVYTGWSPDGWDKNATKKSE